MIEEQPVRQIAGNDEAAAIVFDPGEASA